MSNTLSSLSTNFKKWYDECLKADNVASEVLCCDAAKRDLTVDELNQLLEIFGDIDYVYVDEHKYFVQRNRYEFVCGG